MSSPHRSTAADACPGALRLHDAADGPLARVRIPGGRITGVQLGALREIAAEWGDGHVELTSRANLQLRALNGAPAVRLAARLAAAGLLPSQTHELVRNIAASPLIGDPTPVAALDHALCADPALAALPGRFLFAIDGGAGDVAYSADVASLPAGDRIAVLFAGRDAGLRVGPDQLVPALLAGAHAFLALAGEAVAAGQARPWRLRELTDGPARAAARTAAALGVPLADPAPAPHTAPPPPTDSALPPSQPASHTFPPPPTDSALPPSQPASHTFPPSPTNPAPPPSRPASHTFPPSPTNPAPPPSRPASHTFPPPPTNPAPPPSRPASHEPIGVIDGTAVAALVPLGRLTPAQLTTLSAAAVLVVTPWRGIVVADLDPAEAASWVDRLAATGLEVAAGSPWIGVTTCAGRPGCAKSLADVRSDASAAVRPFDGRVPVHWVGCARGCGAPPGPHVRVEATGSGYLVAGPGGGAAVPARAVDEVAALVTAARKG
ncbi:precorrin-3B synthase [Couchioplanes caeruleus]|uniref:precorrin-3B synthase n=1 Tax=Couchioplanes caeruleus TaxID=56438 RepID=UPI0020C141DE|nr:precorrin-3B synthase [Couchioplanes caeruleus]UQU66557.1 precorrin-3B synthase [Couchioplanes caeruleus]